MNEGTNEYPLANVDVRRNAGIVRDPNDEIKEIQTLLADVYKDAGDGRTLFRELVQNADDAGAQQLRLTILERGWPDTRNSLLGGPALLVANDGPFPAKDREALHKAIGGSKEDDASKIGTFGIGLKSVFHICEAFLYIGVEKSEWRAGVVNPWAGTGESGEADPVHPEWAEVEERLQAVAAELIGDTSNGLMLWIPLRRPEHLDRGTELRKSRPKPDDLCDWFGSPAPAALLLAQCGHLKSIEVYRTQEPESLHDPRRLVRVARQTAGWVGRHVDDSQERPNRAFEGGITSGERNWSVVGIEALGSDNLCQLRLHPDWPQSSQWHDGRHSTVPRKALAHAAVTVLRPDAPNAEPLGTRLRWAVFLPLDDDPEPSSSVIVECHGSFPAWEIILHGYFWPSQDRRSIPGVTDPGDGAGDTDMRNHWNRAVCNDLLLPLLPSALGKAVAGVEERVARKLLDGVVKSEIVRNRSDTVKRRHWLLPMVAADGVRWEARNAKECRVMSIPNWRQAPEVVYRQFVAFCDECRDGVVFIDDDAPRLAGELDDWTVEHLEPLLNSIPNDAFAAPQELKWIRQVVRHILGEGTNGGDNRAVSVSVARWIAERIGERALDPTTRRVSDESQRNAREELRCTWRDLLAALPKEWLLDAPLESQQAVAELATEEMIGEGLIPVPFGRELEPLPSQPDPDRLDSALRVLGRRLAAGGESERLRHSRLLLAETLLSIRDTNRPLNDLETLPLLRTTKMPEKREEAWSVCKLRCQTDTYRVFANPPPVRDSDVHQPERLSDPKQAVKELAAALDEDVWFLIDAGVAALAGTPPPTPDALAGAVSGAKTFHPEPVKRKHLVDRLVQDGGPHVCAVRALLAGRTTAEVGQDTELFFAPRQSVNQQTLDILLRLLGQSWRAVDVELVEVLSQNRIQDLSVSPADARALHRLLNDCLNETVDWAGLSDEEALHLLQHLYGGMAEDQERWRAMPLHRDVDGKRGPLNDRSLRKTEGSDELPLPPELAVTVRLLDPDPSVAHLYASVPVMARDGVLRLMLEDDRPWRFTQQILNSVRSIEGQMTLPRDSELRDLLRHRCWLPHRDGGGFAPDAVLIAPKELQKEVVGLAAAGAFGDKRIPEDVDPGIRQTAEQVIPEILGRLGKHRQVQRIADALNPDQVAQVKGGVYLVMPDPEIVDASLIEDALKTTLADSHLGWKLVNTVERVLGLGHRGGAGLRPASEPLLKLVKALCGPIPPARQIAMLKTLAQSRPAKESPDGRLFRKLLDRFAKTDEFFKSVLSEIELPTQDGNWHASQGVARSESGVARRHRLISELRPSLRLSGDDPVPQTNNVGSGESENESDALEALDNYFEPWRDRLPPGAVGAFLSLLGNGFRGGIAKLAQQWLGDNVSLEGLRTQLASPNGSVPCSDVSVWVNPDVARGDGVSAMNVVGSWVEMEVDAGNETLFAFDPRAAARRHRPCCRNSARSGRSRYAMSSRKAAHNPISLVCLATP